MDKAYSRIVWQNQPSTATALGATNLNKTDVALNTIDDRVVGMDTSKANQSTVNSVVQSITYNESTGVLTITKVNGTSTNIDTKLEKLAVNFAYNPTTQQLDITLDDGTVQHVDMSALVTQYEFDNTGTIAFTLTAGRVTANVVNGSITAEKLHPDYLANLTVQAQIAEENKNIAIEQAGIATDAAGDAETYRDQALQYRNEAEGIVGVGIATESVPGLVKGAGNVSIETNGDMWAEPYKDKATQSGQSVQFPAADNGLVEITSIIGKYSIVPANPALPVSPDNIAVIHNVGDVPFNLGATGKNLFPPLNSLTNAGITLTQSSDGTITLNGTSTNVALFYVPVYIPLRGNYNLSANNTATSTISIKLSRNSSGGDYIRDMTLDSVNKSLAFNVTSDVISYIGVRVPSGVTLTNYAIKPQLETGSVATTYEPYKGNTKSVSDTYGALPDGTRDEFVSDGTTAKDIKRKGRVVFNGTEAVALAETLTNTLRFTIAQGTPNRKDDDSLMVCSHFRCTVRSTTADNEHIRNSATGSQTTLVIYINKTRLATQDAAGFKAWLSSQYSAGTPVAIDYPLATPIESPRDRIFLTSYSGTTNVYTTDPLQPTFTAVAKSELWNDRRNYLLSLDYDTPHYYYEGKKYLINNPYRFGGVLHLKGQMHCHTTNSDGANSPTDLVTAYKNAGYDFITITDHNVVTPDPGVSGITWIGNSVEESYLRHVNAFDVGTDYSGLQSTQDVMSYHKNKGRMTSLNHPNWKNQYILEEFEVKSYYDHNFIEVYNSVVNAYSEEQWDYALSSNRIVFGIAVDDCHDISAFAFNKGWVVVHTNTNLKDDILKSLRDGNFYASTGNDISITLNENVMTSSSTALSNFTFIGRNGRVLSTASNVTNASYTILGTESYVRVKSELVSDITKKAFSQPIFINEMREQYQYSDIYKNIVLSGVNRQALDNGGFDVWERGTSFDFGNTTGAKITADRWIYTQNSGTATIPETTVEKSTMPLDYVPLASNVYKINLNTVGNTSTSTNHYAALTQMIEEGAKNLCAMSKKITISFYARSSISGKKIATEFRLNYGTGGSPSTQVDIPGKVISLTDYWKKHSVTVTLPEVAGSVFGTNNDSYLRLSIWNYWGSAYNSRLGASSAEFPTSTGTVEFMAMTLNSTDLQLPYMPKGCTEESRNCQRHYTHNKELDSSATLYYMAIDTTTLLCNYQFPQTMMKTPTISISFGGVDKRIRKASDGTLLDATSVSVAGNKNMIVQITLTGVTLTAGSYYQFNITAETGF
ncbi:MAG: hypothetical protein K0R78_2666 [Pelosinus sp.]|jgi:hypothetical protein|nr:hypothetical protein [Pelosinus sp.]